MRRIDFILRMLLTIALVAVPLSRPASARPDVPRRPNIILILADDLGYGDLGVYGGKEIPTPNLDALAGGGARFTDGYVTCPICAPTRAALLTGRYQQRFGFEHNPGPEAQASPAFGLPRSERTIAERLKQAGYATAMFGKWHLGYSDGLRPNDRGFDEFFGFLSGARTYLPGDARQRRGGGYNEGIVRNGTPVEEKEYLTDAFAREAVAYITKHAKEGSDTPFFVYLPFNAVHGPMEATRKYTDRFAHISDPNRRTYAGMLTALDEAVGRVLSAVRDAGAESNTLVFFLSDNGGPTQQTTSSNAPLSGAKGQVLEGGIRVPFIMKWPDGRVPAGQVNSSPVSTLDVHATVLSAAGIAFETAPIGAPAVGSVEGQSLLPMVRATDGPGAVGAEARGSDDAVYWRMGNQWAVRMGEWKLVSQAGARAPRRAEARLYNLRDDVAEKVDLAASMPEKVAELKAAYDLWNRGNIEPRWLRAEGRDGDAAIVDPGGAEGGEGSDAVDNADPPRGREDDTPSTRPSGSGVSPQSGQQNQFERLDSNRDGFVDRAEFERAAFARRNPGLFDELDANKDGKVSREESNRVRGGRPQGLGDLPPAREAPVSEIPKPERAGEPAPKDLGDFDAVRDAAGRGQMFEAVHAPGFTNLRESTNGIAVVDINRDGWLDIIATYSPRRGTERDGGVERLRVLLNDGNWNFREHTITLKNSKVALDDFGRGQVPVLADFNHDGFLDLFVTRHATMQGGRNISGRYSHGNSLFISDGAWDVFRDVSDQMGIRNEKAYNRQPSIGDVNKDGWLDVAVGCDNIGDAQGGVPHSRLYIFQPKGGRFEDGTFKDIGGTELVPDFGGFSHDSAKDKAGPNIVLRDADNDSDLDLFQSFHVDVREPLLPYSPGEYRQGVFCWKNLLAETGSLRFEKVTGNGLAVEASLRYNREKQVYEPATDARAPGLPYLFLADVDNDGLQDIFATGPSDTTWSPRSEYVGGRFWKNVGGFRFKESTQAASLNPINNTYRQWYEFFDLPISTFHRNFTPREPKVLGQPGMTPPNPIDNRPYYADGVFADFNNDGWQDLVVLDRRTAGRIETRAVLFMNKGDGTFDVKPTTFSGIDAGGIAGEAADLNNDGLLDLVFAADPDNSGVATDTSQYESRVYWNTGEHGGKQHHWLRMRFAGVTDAQLIGSRVEAASDGRKQYRWITVSQSYKSGGPLEAHVGLANAKSADITITLLDGRTIALPAIAADQYVEIDLTKKTVTPVRVSQASRVKADSPAATVPALKLDIAETVFELVVRDPIAVTKFYCAGLGMREVEPANAETGALLEWAGSYLKIRPVAGPAPAAPPRNPIRQMIASNGYRWFSLWYTDPATMSERLVQQGYPAPTKYTNVWMTRDPEGNLVELMGIPREATRETLSWGMTVSDNDAARAFWSEVLGLKEYRPWRLPGIPQASGGDGAASMMMYVFQGGPGVVKFSSPSGWGQRSRGGTRRTGPAQRDAAGAEHGRGASAAGGPRHEGRGCRSLAADRSGWEPGASREG